MQMTLADGRTQTTEILTTSVDISIQGKFIPTDLLILKNARGNRTLLGIDFLTAAGIVLDLQRKQWYFTETSHRKYNFVKAPLISMLCSLLTLNHIFVNFGKMKVLTFHFHNGKK
ncbi:uncharacterized protein TNCV_1015961 [Trichonephila clavipes]|uniref:Uncharacterized protein n=1 Tax=Trichonephila clavipes TaxID=2585209 RepID=A0A8X6VY34_TRICX|nr:uncharacterized protein TNCV_1015961 [Trichonephila clavipes]